MKEIESIGPFYVPAHLLSFNYSDTTIQEIEQFVWLCISLSGMLEESLSRLNKFFYSLQNKILELIDMC